MRMPSGTGRRRGPLTPDPSPIAHPSPGRGAPPPDPLLHGGSEERGQGGLPPLPGDELPFYHLRLTAPMPPPRGCPRELQTLGDHVKKVRLLRGLIRREAAAALGVSEETIENWETGKTVPRAGLRERITRFLEY